MNDGPSSFEPLQAIVSGLAEQRCQACITIPARDEAESLPRCLDALFRQIDLDGSPIAQDSFEVILLLNNCTDASEAVAREWQKIHPSMALHIVQRTFPAEQAHVGTARRLLMDTAWRRFDRRSKQTAVTAILATDADTVVAPDWIAQSLSALQKGADVVGGVVEVVQEDLASLPANVRRRFERDRRYAGLIAELEHLLDPQECDPWPRHLDHFGSSLACTPHAYAVAGGMPAVSPLEDEAFVDAVRHAGLRLRHDPTVRVSTSARLKGRSAVGLAGQFRLWSQLSCDEAHCVQSAAFLEHRFRSMRRLRQIFATKDLGCFHLYTEWWINTFREALRTQTTCAGFLGAVYCNILINERFQGERLEPIQGAIDGLRERIKAARTRDRRRAQLRA